MFIRKLRNIGLIMKFIVVVIINMDVIFFVILMNLSFVYIIIVGKIMDIVIFRSNENIYMLIMMLYIDVIMKLSIERSIVRFEVKIRFVGLIYCMRNIFRNFFVVNVV